MALTTDKLNRCSEIKQLGDKKIMCNFTAEDMQLIVQLLTKESMDLSNKIKTLHTLDNSYHNAIARLAHVDRLLGRN